MELGLKNKVVIVLASSSGLGKSTALSFATEGAKVIITGRDAERLNKAREEIASKTGAEVEAVQMDVCKIGPGMYHYAAIDDCSRYKVLGLYPRRTAVNTIHFLERVVEEMPFPIQRLQTDRGREFFAFKVQTWLQEYCIKFRPIKPRSPHLNGKVERGHKTDLQEFYATADLSAPDLQDRLDEWQHFYNWHRPHSSLGGKPPIDRYHELSAKTPYQDEVEGNYNPDNEPIREQNYKLDLALRKLK